MTKLKKTNINKNKSATADKKLALIAHKLNSMPVSRLSRKAQSNTPLKYQSRSVLDCKYTKENFEDACFYKFGRPILIKDRACIFYGDTKIGKTTTVLNMLHHLALTKPFLGLQVIRPLSSIYVSFEQSEEVLLKGYYDKTLVGFSQEEQTIIDAKETFYGMDSRVVQSLNLNKAANSIAEMSSFIPTVLDFHRRDKKLEDKELTLIVLDNLSSLIKGNPAEISGLLMEQLSRLMKQENCIIIVIAHTTKSGKLRGSNQVQNLGGKQIELKQGEQSQKVYLSLKHEGGYVLPIRLNDFDNSVEPFYHYDYNHDEEYTNSFADFALDTRGKKPIFIRTKCPENFEKFSLLGLNEENDEIDFVSERDFRLEIEKVLKQGTLAHITDIQIDMFIKELLYEEIVRTYTEKGKTSYIGRVTLSHLQQANARKVS